MTDTTQAQRMQFDAKVEDLKGRLKEAWGDLTDDDLDRAQGQWDRVVALIRERTGESIEKITSRIDGLIDKLQEAGSADKS